MKKPDGKPAVFHGLKDRFTVIAYVGRIKRTIPWREWQQVPVWDGAFSDLICQGSAIRTLTPTVCSSEERLRR
jgi:hypothetical protein